MHLARDAAAVRKQRERSLSWLVERQDLDGGWPASAWSLAPRPDVTDRASFDTFLREVESRLGPLDVLINNAGIMPIGVFVEETDATAHRMIDINLHGVIYGSKLALARFQSRGRGHLVNIASAAGKAGFAGGATYCATKHAVVGLCEAIRAEAERRNWSLVAIFEDTASGKTVANRDGLALAVEAVERGEAAALVVAKLDRLSRNVAFISNLMESGVEFVAADMPMANRLTVHVLAAVAGHEREMHV